MTRSFMVVLLILLASGAPPVSAIKVQNLNPAAPTYTVFATREGLVGHRTANGHRIRPRDRFVALPSWKVLSSRGGNEFQVRVTYRGRSVVLPVWDVGPWNTHDDYWSPNRRYQDLPTGMPMAQAAYQQGYNGGRDEFGRRVGLPNGIDIADGAFWDDLGMVDSDWVEVTFLWLGDDTYTEPPALPPAAPQNQAAAEPGDVVVDDGGNGYQSRAVITWYAEACGLNDKYSWTYGTSDPTLSENSASWRPDLIHPGFYEVFAFIPGCGRPATTAAFYRVFHDGGKTIVPVNQHALAGQWASLGVYHAGKGLVAVELDDVTGDDGLSVRFDAVKWVPKVDITPPEARVIDALIQDEGHVLVRWSGVDDISGVASYDVQVRRLPDGNWSNWQVGVVVSEAIFVPSESGGYAFRVRARDWVGNEQRWNEGNNVFVEVTVNPQ